MTPHRSRKGLWSILCAVAAVVVSIGSVLATFAPMLRGEFQSALVVGLVAFVIYWLVVPALLVAGISLSIIGIARSEHGRIALVTGLVLNLLLALISIGVAWIAFAEIGNADATAAAALPSVVLAALAK